VPDLNDKENTEKEEPRGAVTYTQGQEKNSKVTL